MEQYAVGPTMRRLKLTKQLNMLPPDELARLSAPIIEAYRQRWIWPLSTFEAEVLFKRARPASRRPLVLH